MADSYRRVLTDCTVLLAWGILVQPVFAQQQVVTSPADQTGQSQMTAGQVANSPISQIGQNQTFVGQVANSSVGQVGQRQTAANVAPNLNPIGRIDNRIANRIQSRIRNRIDQYYDPQANTLSPFVVASDSARKR